MVNSPGPSSSKTVEPEHCKTTNCENIDNNAKKKKRTRRKPRSKVKKEVPDLDLSVHKSVERTEDLLDVDIHFVIEPVKEQPGIFYRQRDKSFDYIKLHSFIKDTMPHIFITKSACDSAAAARILEKAGRLSVNGVCIPGINRLSVKDNKDATQRIEKKKKKEKKKKAVKLFSSYISQEEVEIGLKNGELMKGAIRINPKNFKESYVGNEDISKTDYIIGSVLDRNRALDGDEVILRLKTVNEEKKKLMEVVYITRKVHPRTAVGYLEPIDKNKEFALFTPRDKRIPKMKIPKISWPSGFQTDPQLYRDILFIAKISDWKEVKYALGTIIENLGLNGDLKVESLAILREFCLDPTPYGDDIKQFLPKSSDIPKKEFERRDDIRKECVFTIDPATARDLDDAVSCKELPNGNYEVGVHISDASYYLKENTRLDEQVKKKATTIYMVDSVYHMLPVELCLQCSLLPGEDKLSFSVFWEMTSSGEVVNTRINKTVMNSCVQLSYEHAQTMIDDPETSLDEEDLPTIYNGYKPEDISRVVNNLQKIAVNLREKRKKNGALKIDQVKISFSLDPLTGQPLNFWVYENKAAHRLIEEFMLLANMTVAERIYEVYPDLAFLRLHEAPKPTMMYELQKNLETVGIHIDISSSGGIQSSLNKYVDEDFLGRARMVVLNHLLAKPMKRARYFCAGALESDTSFSHFALSIPIYTHFTSPIRRYADIMTHRLLAASLGYCDKPKWLPEEVAEVAENCNRQKYHAKRAGEASSDLYLVHFIDEHQPYVQDAVVVDAKERSIDVIVLNTGTVVRIYTNNFGENVTWKSEEIQVLRDPDISNDANSKKMWKIIVKFPRTALEGEAIIVLEMFTLVRVELSRKPKTNKLEAKLLRPLQQLNLVQ